MIKGEKISKSKGNAVDPYEMVARYGVDAYRYFLMREVAFGLDGAFSEETLIRRYNSDLANDIGNLVSRTLSMVDKYYGGMIPEIEGGKIVLKDTAVLMQSALGIAGTMDRSMPRLDFAGALTGIWSSINVANKYIESVKPWALAKDGKTAELKEVIYTLSEVLRIISVAVYPFMPDTAQKISVRIGIKDDLSSILSSYIAKWGALKPGTKVDKGEPLFPRIEISK